MANHGRAYIARKEYVDYQKGLKKYGEFGLSWKRYYWNIPGYKKTPVYKNYGPIELLNKSF